MLSWPPTVRIFLGAEPTDMRKGFDSLAHLVESSMTLDPLSGHLFVFRSRRGDRIKVLCWDRDGYCPVVQAAGKGQLPLPGRDGGGRVEGRGGQGGGPDDDPRRGRPGQRPAAATLLPRNRRKSSMRGPFRKSFAAVQSWHVRARRAPARRPGPLPRDHPPAGGHDPGVPAADRATGAPGRAAAPSPVRPPAGERRSRPAPAVHRRCPRRRRRGYHRGAPGVGGRETEAALAAQGAADAPRGPAPEADRVRAVRRGVALPGLRTHAHQDRRGGQRAAGVRAVVALRHRHTRDSATPVAPARSTSPSRTSRRSRSTRGCPARVSWPRRSRASIATTSRSTGSKTSSPATGWSCRGPRSAAGWPPVPSCSRRSTT